VVAPVLLAGVFGVRRALGRAACVALVAATFSLAKLWSPAARALEQTMAALGLPLRLWCDPSDLLALPALALAWWLLTRAAPPAAAAARRRTLETAGAMVGAIACMATSPLPPPAPHVSGGRVVAQVWPGYPYQILESASGRLLAVIDGDGWATACDEEAGLFFAVRNRQVVGLAIDGGARVLDYEAGTGSFHPLLLLDQDHVYLVSRSGTAQERLVALARRPDAGSKAVSWSASLPSAESWREPSEMPILAAGVVVVPAESALLAFAAASGRRLWRYQASTPLRWLTTSGPQIFAVDESGTIHAIDNASGKSRWRLATGSAEAFEEGDWRGGPRLAARAGSVLFVQKGRLVAVDASSRARRWTGPAVSEVSFGDTTAFVAFPEGEVEDQVGLIDLRDGRVRWRRELDELLLTAPRVAEGEGIVLVRPHAEVLYAFELGSGALRWKIELGTGELPFSDEETAPVRDHTLIGPAAQGS
jgi:outer membrane protein assembly factor BamB